MTSLSTKALYLNPFFFVKSQHTTGILKLYYVVQSRGRVSHGTPRKQRKKRNVTFNEQVLVIFFLMGGGNVVPEVREGLPMEYGMLDISVPML